jgi:hypothetical protein
MPGSNLAVVVGAEVVKTLLMMAFQNVSSKNPATLRATLKDLGRE